MDSSTLHGTGYVSRIFFHILCIICGSFGGGGGGGWGGGGGIAPCAPMQDLPISIVQMYSLYIPFVGLGSLNKTHMKYETS